MDFNKRVLQGRSLYVTIYLISYTYAVSSIIYHFVGLQDVRYMIDRILWRCRKTKLVKGLLLVLIITSVLAMTGVSADVSGYMGYNDIKLPILNGIYSDGDYTKTTVNPQTLETTDARDSWIWNDTRVVEARTMQVLSPISTTKWKDIVIGGTITWDEENADIGSYRLQLRAKKSTLSEVRYWGIWVY